MTKEEIEKIVAESVRPLTEKFAGPEKKETPVKEERLYREGGLEEVPGTNNTVWRMPGKS